MHIQDFRYPMRPSDEARILSLVKDPLAWYWQPKYNGWHVLALPDGQLFTRHGQDISEWPGVQGIRNALRIQHPVVGELLNGSSHDDIQSLQRRGTGKLMIFDCVTRGTFAERSFACARIPTTRDVVESGETHIPCKSWEGIKQCLVAQQHAGHEGIVLKHRDGLYELGKARSIESRLQVKLKHVATLNTLN